MAYIQPPSTALPPLKRLHTHSATQISLLLKLLRTLYEAPVVGSKPAQDSGYASEASDDEDDDGSRVVKDSKDALDDIRADRFERSVAVKWLVGLAGRGGEWVEDASEDEEEYNRRTAVVDDAAALLGAVSGLATGPLMRTFEFTREAAGSDPIIIYLRDASILNEDHTSVGLQTWGSSCILGRRMVQHPSKFGLERAVGGPPLRILELGAGTGLMSMLIAKLLPRQDARMIATDYHPAVLDNLRSNIAGNFPLNSDEAPEILSLDWRHLHSLVTNGTSDSRALETPFNEPFDQVVGADIIYEPSHAVWIKSSVQLLLKKPAGLLHLIMPTRPTHEAETASVREIFPLAEDVRARRQAGGAGSKEDDLEIAVLDVEEIDRIVGTGRADEMRYFLYRIGWA